MIDVYTRALSTTAPAIDAELMKRGLNADRLAKAAFDALTRANLALIDAEELARLREALKPFALFADALAKDRKLKATDPVYEIGNAMCEMTLAYSVFQQARAALSPEEKLNARPWVKGCHADRDGDCNWEGCPQLRDNEPDATGRFCPLVAPDDET